MTKTRLYRYFNDLNFAIKNKKTFLACALLIINSQLFAEEGYSEINNALFDNPHMQNIKVPGTLIYSYQKTRTDEVPIKDIVSVDINNITATGRTDQTYNFFTGKNKRPYQSRTNQSGNGIFMLFLEWDVHQLERETEGSWRHFQRRIRWAMAEGAKKKQVQIIYNGNSVEGTQYTIQPYADDEKSARLGSYANKYYSFTLSKEIPGMIYQVRTVIPEEKKWVEGDKSISVESITFTGFKPQQENNTD